MDAAQDAVNDIFSLSDDVLADKLTFIEEIGNGNWGSVWRCKPKADPTAATAEDFDKVLRPHIAVKVVHRESKSKTSVARVKSLWNEMKIIRTFKNDPHPSIIPFYSFIITPSFALITMALLPTLVPVEVEESAARGWFRYLLSGVEFLHKRGIVHNDIKPANILISEKNIPVLVDFGFAEKYDLSSDTAFHSKVAYGTPEYLSPERAREMPHDTRKSDVWSLGVTFFEILAGRTPFEKSDQEQFTTKEDLEEYWARTLRGQWIGNWKMSRGMEKLLRRMIAPNADLRCTISHAMKDAYWTAVRETESQHRRSASHTSTIVFEKDLSKLIDYASTPTRPRSVRGKENVNTPPGLFSPKTRHDDPLGHHFIGRSKSQPKLEAPKAPEIHPRKRIPAPPLSDLSPIKASPPVSPAATPIAKTALHARTNVKNRQPLGAQTRNNLPARRGNGKDMHSKKDRTAHAPTSPSKDEKENHVNQRVKDWEKLREISRMDDTEDETDLGEDAGRASSSSSPEDDDSDTEEGVEDRRDHALPPVPVQSMLPETPGRTTPAYIPALPTFSPITLRKQPSSQEFGKASATGGPSSFSPRSMSKRSSASGLNGLKQGIKQSIDKTLQLYKSSLQGHKKAHSLSVDLNDASQAVDPWMGNPSYLNASTPALGEAPRDPQAADRISLWMKNVEKVVDDARQGFAPSPPPVEEVENPPLSPPARLSSSQRSRSYRSSRLPRRLLAANQIFGDDTERGLSPNSSHVTSCLETGAATSRQHSSSRTSLTDERRESLSTGSKDLSSKRTEKSRSRADVLGMRISPDIAAKRSGSSKMSSPKPSPPLDRRMFIATPQRSDESIRGGAITPMSKSFDELTSSPLHVEPYPQRQLKGNIPLPDTPNQRRLEGVYDRFLMATSGVKRLGKGYQSENTGPVYHTVQGHGMERKKSAFASMRRSQLPPPVSSDDPPPKGAMSVDELGMMTYSGAPPSTTSSGKDDSNATVARMRRAIKAIVPGRTVVSRRMSSRVPA